MRRALARVCIAIDHTSENGLALRLLELDRPFAIFVAIDGVHQEPFCRNGVLQVEVPASVPQNHLMVFFGAFSLPLRGGASSCDGDMRLLLWRTEAAAFVVHGVCRIGLWSRWFNRRLPGFRPQLSSHQNELENPD